MLLTVLGTPSAFTAWSIMLLRTAVEVTRGKFQYIAAVKFADLEKAFGARANDQVIIYSDSPDAKMADLLLRVKAPLTIFVEEPADVVGYVMKARELDARKSIRFACLCYTCLSTFHGSLSARIFHRRSNTTVRRFLREVSAHYGLNLSEADTEKVLSRLIKDYRRGTDPSVESQILQQVEIAKPLGRWATELDRDDRELVELVLQPYYRMIEGRPPAQFIWPKQLFHTANEKGAYVSGPLELAGRSRFVIYAPHLCLPRGFWSATVQIKIGESYSQNTLLVDVKCGEVLSGGRIDLPESGTFIFSLPFAIEDHRVPIEIRFFLEKGAIEGWIDLVSVTLERAPQGAAA
ncbi:hypothetical protein [Pseudorhodoplanes sp.]|uniref:hypothetical protein n=1 Tax=Pseudorhodoplanes sp. TaxID=1934341 RepID=UPI003D0EC3B3